MRRCHCTFTESCSRPEVQPFTKPCTHAHRTGDVVLINQRCAKLPPPQAALCWLSKFGLSGDGRGCWDHAAFVLRDSVTDVPYLLEGGLSGVTMRTYEERLLQNGGYREEMTLLPLRGLESSTAAQPARMDALLQARRPRAGALRHRSSSGLPALPQEMKMSRTRDGMDGPADGARCENLWTIYQQMRSPPTSYAERARSTAAAASSPPSLCTFGAPLVGRALQRLGALEGKVDVSRLTPASFTHAMLTPPARFGTPVPLR